MRLTIQNFNKVYDPLNVNLFDFGNWFIDDADTLEDVYFILFRHTQPVFNKYHFGRSNLTRR
jgi:hypothetical protein